MGQSFKMLLKLITLILVAHVFAAPRDIAGPCQSDCLLPNCLCASTSPPGGLSPSEIPQLVVLTFDDAINTGNIGYYRQAFYDRINPNGCPVSTTYFMTHEYTDYSLVHELWSKGHEIALHSITHQVPASYWQTLSIDLYRSEFEDQIDLVSHFANIPGNGIKGMRIPFLQLAGNNSFRMIEMTSLEYDASWPTQTYRDPALFPYTLDYNSPQDCALPPCPTESIKGVWVMPMVDWTDDLNYPCAMVDSCVNIPQDESGLLNFMKRNFHNHYDGSRAPFGFYIHAAWFGKNPEHHFPAYLKFLDYLGGLNDVFIVSEQNVLDWMRNPTPLRTYTKAVACNPQYPNTCTHPKSCELRKGQEIRYMTVCSDFCPNTYPWLHNPLGA